MEPAPWHDAALNVAYQFDRLTWAKDLFTQADALIELSNAVHDLKTWLPGWDGETGTMPWDRED